MKNIPPGNKVMTTLVLPIAVDILQEWTCIGSVFVLQALSTFIYVQPYTCAALQGVCSVSH